MRRLLYLWGEIRRDAIAHTFEHSGDCSKHSTGLILATLTRLYVRTKNFIHEEAESSVLRDVRRI